MSLFDSRLSPLRTVLFGGLAIVWFSEMTFLGFQSLSTDWAHRWQVAVPDSPQLAAALSAIWASSSPSKAALGVLAVWGVRSKSPFVRTALFASMALVPPLNIAFPFRQQGFLLRPVAVATILSTILWGSFFLFPERAARPERAETRDPDLTPSSRWEILQYAWFATTSTAVTVMALLCIFWPSTALRLILPSLSSLTGLLDADQTALASLIHTTMASGTHLLAVAIACWIATVSCRRQPELRRAVTLAGVVHAGLFLVFPLRQIAASWGWRSAASSILAVSIPLFFGWVLYAALARTPSAATSASKAAP